MPQNMRNKIIQITKQISLKSQLKVTMVTGLCVTYHAKNIELTEA